ncbi:tRNA preQ1(34) S-adenosylmethionine ribosyltransferase-isomerase QueA [Calorimonas adulescens]|uniref:S-adenosylmethionine:tRNA ribosyltransferase-isomerase n=1 Tax=Calorimonas adulescens TaxID=2606906 RepID=A0A5D8QH53_9THEO|nr:tRNA preQ1(34) S-adenosylmethionine ribosyltransferase-isomerase QueA [Calorimonas adulescens]TZE83579.1 tRNA preQ1(34) S-adenosylmethionine ribosyltransferase-isomerase QueA [Calorimonas adulescens]
MNVHDFYFELPEELIAQRPLVERDLAKLMVLHKDTGEIEHKIFKDVIEYLESGDCLVLNDTRVIPARLLGRKADTMGKMEFVLLTNKGDNVWEVLVKPGRRAKIGSRFVFGEGELTAKVLDVTKDGTRIVRFYYDGLFEEVLDKLGRMPLPPYIKKQLDDNEMYQTVYSKHEGSAAAPTAGLHFTNELLKDIEAKGVNLVYITLHVGLGTFRPVKVENVEEHEMHSEFFIVNKEAADTVNQAKRRGKKIVSVGTTSTRTLEASCDEDGNVIPQSGWTDIFIYPGYKFKVIDALITNFHLPESTLIMLVSALAGRENILNAYRIAVENRYRFFSFGDAMLIV